MNRRDLFRGAAGSAAMAGSAVGGMSPARLLEREPVHRR